ncbi:MAG: molecular chaperone HtpG, partial [Coriobacteriales bacterium]|nr:molecular chaperone HtpG [Coriobacteriales bacterium]
EIFLRELISNASDAEDKLYLASLTNTSIKLVKSELAITIAFDKEAGTITISDNGIGMSKDDLEKNLGTIAHSGSLEFREANEAKQGDDIDIIGQFGVGFYSGFMVAQQVRVVSRALGSNEAWAWQSDGIEGYTLAEASREERGTDVILTLKKDTDEETYSSFLSEYELKRLVRKYSNYVRYPVRMEVSKSRALPKPDDAPDDYKTEYESYTELETLNSMIPIWKRDKKDVTEEDYAEFYKSDFHDYAAPLSTFTLHAEGTLSYDALLFIPSHAPFDLYSKDFDKGLALYSSNVLIMDKCPDLLSDHFNFVRGVVDSADLNLNISRETLQHNSQLRAIAKRIEKKLISELGTLRDEKREDYEGIFECFGRGIKYGIYSSYGALKDTLADLLLYYSATQEKLVTLREYLDAAPSTQEAIYYAAGDDEQKLAKMPMVKSVLAKGYDVLLCVDDVDDFCLSVMANYDEKALKNVAASDLGLETEAEKEQVESLTKDNEQLFEALHEALGEKVTKVIASTRLVDVPAGISAEGPISLEMEKGLAAGPEGKGIKSERVLEVNVNHPVFVKLTEAQASNNAEKIKLFADILYNQALLVEGLPIDDPVAFAQTVSELMV